MNRLAIPACAGSILLAAASAASADIVTQWNQLALDSIAQTAGGPPPSARIAAMMHVAMFDAANGITGGYQQYHAGVCPTGGADAQAAAARAARDVLVAAYPSRAAIYDAALAGQLAAIPDGPARQAGLAYGASVAQGTLALRSTDGATNPSTYVPSGLPGRWVPTPPGNAPAAFQPFAQVTPWSLNSTTQFRPAAPPSINSPEYAAAFEEVRVLGSASSATRTDDQTQIASFWAAGSGTVTPPGMWNQIAQRTLPAQSLVDSARSFALLNIALADAAVVAWDAKVAYDYWRPVTGIRRAGEDGLDSTVADPSWTPLLVTPAFQAYVSGHSTFSSAGAGVLSDLLGTESVNFSLSAAGFTRSFTSLTGAAAEAGQSRIYGGIHWQFDNTAGLEAGASLADWVTGTQLRVPGPGGAALLSLAGLLASRRRRVA